MNWKEKERMFLNVMLFNVLEEYRYHGRGKKQCGWVSVDSVIVGSLVYVLDNILSEIIADININNKFSEEVRSVNIRLEIDKHLEFALENFSEKYCEILNLLKQKSNKGEK